LASQNSNGSLNPDHATFRGNLSTKFEIYNSTCYEDMKGDTQCRKWVVWGSWESCEVIRNHAIDTAYTISY